MAHVNNTRGRKVTPLFLNQRHRPRVKRYALFAPNCRFESPPCLALSMSASSALYHCILIGRCTQHIINYRLFFILSTSVKITLINTTAYAEKWRKPPARRSLTYRRLSPNYDSSTRFKFVALNEADLNAIIYNIYQFFHPKKITNNLFTVPF